VNSQIISGTWKGNYSKTLSHNPKSLLLDFFVSNDSIITGSSHLFYNSGGYEHHKIAGMYNKKDSILTFSETLIGSSRPAYEVFYKMKLQDAGQCWRLEGNWKAKKNKSEKFLYINKVWLEKPKDSINILVADEHRKIDVITKELTRASDIQSIIEIRNIEKDSIRISLFDNGIIDNDSVSLYFNDSLLIPNQMVSDKAITIYLSLSPKIQSQKVKIIANNMGTIPPNTTVMIITTKLKRYEVRLHSTFEKNAVVEFFLID
jgi:hypothetical protein